jgi:hypothetical protein
MLTAVVVGSTVALGGCSTPDPAPTPTPTGFADEAEAFAAAEETYRAYVDALNQVDLADPATFEDVYAWTTGESNANERESLSTMHAEGWAVSGETLVIGFYGEEFTAEDGTVTARVCSDVSAVGVTNALGESQVSADRAPVYELEVTFVTTQSHGDNLQIASSEAVELSKCA